MPVPLPGKRKGKVKPVWGGTNKWKCWGFIIGPDTLLVGHLSVKTKKPALTLLNQKDGSEIWTHELPAEVVKWGTAVDIKGRIVVCLKNGQILCFGRAE